MTKDEAEREVIRRWRALSVMERRTFAQAVEFAKSLANVIEFHTTGNIGKVMAAWLIRDVEQAGAALQTLDTRAGSSAGGHHRAETGARNR